MIDKDIQSTIIQVLDREFTKDFLQKNWLPYFGKIYPKHGKELKEKGYGLMLPEKLSDVPMKTKMDVIMAIMFLFSGPEPYRYFRESLNEEVMRTWDALIINGIMGLYQTQEELGVNLLLNSNEKSSYYYKEVNINPLFSLFPLKFPSFGYEREEHAFIFLPRDLRQILIKWYELPTTSTLMPMDTLPNGSFTFNEVEELFFTDYSRLNIYYKQNEIAYSSKRRPIPSGLPKIQRLIQIKEFFPDSDIKRHRFLRTNILASIIPYLVELQKNHTEIHLILREFFNKYYLNYCISIPMLLPDIKGLGYFDNHNFMRYEFQLMTLLKNLPQNSYVSVQNIVSYSTFNLFNLEVISRYESYQKLTIEGNAKNKFNNSINSNNYKKVLQRPILRGSFFLFASLGLCELVYDEKKLDDFSNPASSAWDGLIAVKRTPLGDFICGLTEEYQLPNKKNIGITLSDSSLLIQLDKTESSYLATIANFAEQINPLTFKTDARIFLKNIRSKEELNAKIELFKQIFSGKIHENWITFFNMLLQKVNPLLPVIESYIFQIPKDNNEFIKLIAHDPVIKKLVQKAEGYQIVISKSNYSNFKKRLTEFGYLLEW